MRIETYRLVYSTYFHDFLFTQGNDDKYITLCYDKNLPTKKLPNSSFFCRSGLTYKLSFASQVTSFHRVIFYNLNQYKSKLFLHFTPFP